MIDQPCCRCRGRSRIAPPLYYQKCTKTNGETLEVSVGPCAVDVLGFLITMLVWTIIVLGHPPAELIKAIRTLALLVKLLTG